jgi:hypothetical protein
MVACAQREKIAKNCHDQSCRNMTSFITSCFAKNKITWLKNIQSNVTALSAADFLRECALHTMLSTEIVNKKHVIFTLLHDLSISHSIASIPRDSVQVPSRRFL